MSDCYAYFCWDPVVNGFVVYMRSSLEKNYSVVLEDGWTQKSHLDRLPKVFTHEDAIIAAANINTEFVLPSPEVSS